LPNIAKSGLDVFPLCLGGNVFGWTADEAQSFAVLDAYLDAGGNFVDTADAYSAWVPGHKGGESEEILGRWMKHRECRNRIVVATKVGKLPSLRGLSAKTIEAAAEASLKRLATDRIDLYYAHADDEKTPLVETLTAFAALVKSGKVSAVAASNYSAKRFAEALAIQEKNGLARFVAVQDHHNLVHRSTYEGELAELCTREGLAFLPYYALAQGFLAGKYRAGAAVGGRPGAYPAREATRGDAPAPSPRSAGAQKYLDPRGLRVLAAVDAVAAAHATTAAAVSLAWLLAQRNVVAPIASARTPAQLAELLPMVSLRLTPEELARLTAAGK